jgi:hypothetical protein
LRLLHALPEQGAFRNRDFRKFGSEAMPVDRPRRLRLGSLVEIARTAGALLGHGSPCGESEFRAALIEQHPQFLDALALLGIGADQPLELVDLLAGKPPLAVIDVAASALVLVQDEPPESCFGPGDAGIDRPCQQVDVIGMPLARKRAVPRLVRHGD